MTSSLATKLYIILCVLALAAPALAQQGNARGPIGESPYDIVSGWHQPFQEKGFAFGGNSGVWTESPNRIWLINEAFHQIYVIANDGGEVLPLAAP